MIYENVFKSRFLLRLYLDCLHYRGRSCKFPKGVNPLLREG